MALAAAEGCAELAAAEGRAEQLRAAAPGSRRCSCFGPPRSLAPRLFGFSELPLTIPCEDAETPYGLKEVRAAIGSFAVGKQRGVGDELCLTREEHDHEARARKILLGRDAAKAKLLEQIVGVGVTVGKILEVRAAEEVDELLLDDATPLDTKPAEILKQPAFSKPKPPGRRGKRRLIKKKA